VTVCPIVIINFVECLHRIVLETEGREIAEKVAGHGLESASSAEQVGCSCIYFNFGLK
jgi:hypothetical protein